MKKEILRKLIHLSSLIYPFLYLFYLTKWQILTITLGIFFALATIDYLREKHENCRNFFNKFFAIFSREEEIRGEVYGSTYFMCGISLAIMLFSKEIAIASMLVLIISDTLASLIGKLVKGPRLIGSKTLSGFLAFVLSAGAILYQFDAVFIWASIPTAICELISKKIKLDDNLIIPLACGFFCTLII
jgi:phytol kinase